MQSFLLNISRIPDRQAIEKHSFVAETILNRLGLGGHDFRHETFSFFGNQVLLTTISPNFPNVKKLIDYYSTSHAVYFFFGELYEKPESTAKELSNKWEKYGTLLARQMEGAYAGIKVEKESLQTTIITDLLGRRSLSFYETDQSIHISSHEVFLAQILRKKWEMDYTSIASSLLFGWALGGKSFLKTIYTTHPNRIVSWKRDKGIEIAFNPLILQEERLHPQDKTSKKQHIESLIEQLKTNLRSVSLIYPVVEIFLTAGLDSRVVAGLAKSVVPKEKLRAVTDGENGVLDVDVAEAIAKRMGIPHIKRQTVIPDQNTFLQHLYLLAFAMNGDTGASRAISPYPSFSEVDTVRLYGTGGEIYRGYYYGGRNKEQLQRLTVEDAYEQLRKKYIIRNHSLPWLDQTMVDQVNNRLFTELEELRGISDSGADLLDLFYLYERYCRWGAMSMQFSWRNQFSPFDSPAAVRSMYKLPTPISQDAILFKKIVRDELPGEYWRPLNAKDLLPLFSNESAYQILTRLINTTKRTLVRNNSKTKSKGDRRSKAFDHYLEENLLEHLNIEHLVNNVFAGKSPDNLPKETLARLITIAAFFKQVNN